MKKIKCIFIALIMFISCTGFVKAASVYVNITTNNKTVIVGNTYYAYITMSSSNAIGAYNIELSRSSNLSISSCSPSSEYNYYVLAGFGSSSLKSKTFTCTFKVTSSGTAKLGVKSVDVADYDTDKAMPSSTSGITLNAMTYSQIQATYSKDNNLANLTVEGFKISPEFSKDTLEYSLEVENNVESVNIIASKNESHQSIIGSGTTSLSEGVNSIKIDVEAQNGNIKTYTINITRKELNPIVVTVDNKKYTVVRKSVDLKSPNELFEEKTVTINNEQVPSFYNEKLNYNLVGLKDEQGKIKLYIYDNNKYTLYKEINTGSVILIPLESKETPTNYKECTIKINKIEYNAYKTDKTSKFALIYGVDLENGNEGFYTYDEKYSTLQRYNHDEVNVLNEKIENQKNIGYVLIGLCLLFAIISILTLVSKLKSNKKVQKKIEDTKKDIDKKLENTLDMATLEKTVVLDEQSVLEQSDEPVDNKKKKNKKK